MAKPRALIEAGGIRTLARSLRILEDKELSDEMRAASKAAAEKIVPYAKEKVPVGATGRLKASIKADATRSRAIIKAGTPTRVPYALAVHRGRYIKSTGSRTKGAPFIRKAIPEAWPEIIEVFVKGMNRIAKDFEKKHGASRVVGRYKK